MVSDAETLAGWGCGTSLAGRLQMIDARTMQWSEIRIGRQAACAVCRERGHLDGAAAHGQR